MGSWPWGLGSTPGAKPWESARCCWMKVPSATVSPSPARGAHSWAVLGAGVRGEQASGGQGGGHCSGASYPHGLNFSPPLCPGLCPAVRHDWAFQDRDTQFYRFPGPEPEPAGVHELEEEFVEALALLSQRGPDALLTVALRKP